MAEDCSIPSQLSSVFIVEKSQAYLMNFWGSWKPYFQFDFFAFAPLASLQGNMP